MKTTAVLVFEYQSDYLTANALYCLVCSKQFETHLLSRNQNSPYRFMPGVKTFHYSPENQPDEVLLDFIQQVAQRTNTKVLVPTNTPGVNFVIQHKATLLQFIKIMPLPERWAFDIAADKGLLAVFMHEHAIPTPQTIIDLTNNLDKALDNITFPVLLKPRIGEGGYGAAKEDPPITPFRDKITLLDFIRKHNLATRYIIQQLVEGYVVGCNVLYMKGKLIAHTIQKSLIPARPFAPSLGIEFIDSEEAINMVDALMSKLQWSGVANLDLIYDTQNQKLLVLEINPRFWLTLIGSMVGGNINFPALACQLALNRPVEPTQYHLGKYITLGALIDHKLAAAPTEKVTFRWNEIDLLYFMKTLTFKAYRFYHEKISKSMPGRNVQIY